MSKRIDDFGEKIGGAKKDIWGKRGLSINDVKDRRLEEYIQYITKENIWPAPNYEEYLDIGMEPVCIYFMKNIRDKVKPRLTMNEAVYKENSVSNYIQFINDVRGCCEKTLTPDDAKKFTDTLVYGYDYKDTNNTWGAKAYHTPGFDDTFLRAVQRLQADIEALGYETKIQDFPYSFRGDLKGVTIRKKYNGRYCIAKGSKVLIRDRDFDTIDDAMEFATTKLIDILDGNKTDKGKKSKTKKVVRPQLEHIQRTGPDIRKGRNLKPEALINIFKFRGGEFGNWNTQADRQAYITYTFDALVDLAHAIKAPVEFISLGGSKKLAIAFGSRGGGRASAHYEPERVVINLTKMNGAGSLAHEWGHALDHFLGYHCKVGKYISEYRYGGGYKHENVLKRFKSVMDKIMTYDNGMQTNYYNEARQLDRGRAKKYYSKEEELFARAFESFIEDNLGFKSNYLVHSTNNSCYNGLNPYPSGDDRKIINRAIEGLMVEVVKEFAHMYKPINPKIYGENTDWSDKYSKKEVVSKVGGNIEEKSDVNSTRVLREKLTENAYKLVPGTRKIDNAELIAQLIIVARSELNLGTIEIGDVPISKARGNSKGWTTLNGMLIVNGKEKEEKILESIIEPIVMVLMMGKFGNSQETSMVSSGVVYMICKRLGLDVRTYCISKDFEELVKYKDKTEYYISLCRDGYSFILGVIGLKSIFY